MHKRFTHFMNSNDLVGIQYLLNKGIQVSVLCCFQTVNGSLGHRNRWSNVNGIWIYSELIWVTVEGVYCSYLDNDCLQYLIWREGNALH
jgi:hypothetical protein